jgi:hypothetical protein
VARGACSYCGERQRVKPAQVYVWWYVGEDRVSYKLLTCPECLGARWQKILQTSNLASTGPITCIGCGGLLETDDSTVYLNLYLPKQPERQFELDFDAPCAESIFGDISEYGTRLANRGAQGSGAGNLAPEPSPWDSLEL